MKTILILKDTHSGFNAYFIDHYAKCWQKLGYKVIEHVGVKSLPHADLLLLHIDKTVVPNEYLKVAKKYPNALNAQVESISKKNYSQLLLNQDDHYPLPVIVKTNKNSGGVPEALKEWKQSDRLQQAEFWEEVKFLDPLRYPIFKNLNAVPLGVWKNPNLIVEKYLVARADNFFRVFYTIFMGDKFISGVLSGKNPIVKFSNAETDELCETPDIVHQWRKELNLDFGRLDYVKKGDQCFLIDVNKTEGGGGASYDDSEETAYLAKGIESYFQ